MRAAAFAGEALKIAKRKFLEQRALMRPKRCSLALVLESQLDYTAAREYFRRELKIYKQLRGEEHADTANGTMFRQDILKRQGDQNGARTYLEQALQIRRKVLGPGTRRSRVDSERVGIRNDVAWQLRGHAVI